eukprot:730452-Prymnesium_polylepis.1
MLFGAVTGAARVGRSCSVLFRRARCTGSTVFTRQVAKACASLGIYGLLLGALIHKQYPKMAEI